MPHPNGRKNTPRPRSVNNNQKAFLCECKRSGLEFWFSLRGVQLIYRRETTMGECKKDASYIETWAAFSFDEPQVLAEHRNSRQDQNEQLLPSRPEAAR